MICFILEKQAKNEAGTNSKRNSANEFVTKICCLNVHYNTAGG